MMLYSIAPLQKCSGVSRKALFLHGTLRLQTSADSPLDRAGEPCRSALGTSRQWLDCWSTSAARFLRGVAGGSFAFAVFFLIVAALLEQWGIAATFSLALVATLLVHGCSLLFVRG